MKVFKFGGASVNNAEAIRNLSRIVKQQSSPEEELLIVVSAMGKTTNALEQVVNHLFESKPEWVEFFQKIKNDHLDVVRLLFEDEYSSVFHVVSNFFDELERHIYSLNTHNYDFLYDQIVSLGELVSTKIVSEYLNQEKVINQWIDARDFLITDNTFREAKIEWTQTQKNIHERLRKLFVEVKIVITQGFIASTEKKETTTLGREGSDYTGAIFAFCLDAESITIWKDVPGFLNADPKYYPHTIKLEQIPYGEAIELSYYGATIIHPKTIKPLENKRIPLYVKSFLNPNDSGSVIGQVPHIIPQVPSYIFKNHQVLLSLYPSDFSFISENALCVLFGIFAKHQIKVNLMQNSAISFSVCVDAKESIFKALIPELEENFKVKYNTKLQLITIRYYTQKVIDDVVGQQEIMLEQKSRITAQLIVKEL